MNGTELGFELSSEECSALRDESVQYYHRYLAEFVLEDFDGVEADTARNLRTLDLCRRFAREDADRQALERHRPYLIMMNTRARAHLALRRGAFKTALARVHAGLRLIHSCLASLDQEESFEELTEVGILQSLAAEIAARLPADPMQKLEKELQRALDEERYEDAAVLRDRLATMQGEQAGAAVRKRED